MLGRVGLDFSLALSEAFGAMGRALTASVQAVGTACSVSAIFTKDTIRAYYNVAGQYTFPIEQEFYNNNNIPTPFDLSILGSIALTAVPVTIASVLASVTIVPLLGNSIESFPRAFVDVTNLALLDFPEGKLNKPNMSNIVNNQHDNRNLLRKAYGFPGYLGGAVVGASAATVIGMTRVLTNSVKTGLDVFLSMTRYTWHLNDDAQPANAAPPAPPTTQRPLFRKYVLGAPGALVGGFFGLFSSTVIAGLHIAVNSWKSGARIFKQTANVFLHQDDELTVNDDARQAHRYYGFGLPGLALGTLAGLVSWPVIAATRLVTNNLKTFKRAFISSLNLGLPEESKIENGLEQNDDRPIWLKYIIASPGFFLGAATGFLSAIIASSANTFARTYLTVARSTLPSEVRPTTWNLEDDDNRPWYSKYGLGLPGLIFGLVPGVAVAASIGAIRIVTNSLKTTRDVFKSVTKFVWHLDDDVQPANAAQNQAAPAQIRSSFRKYVLGAPGLILGTAFAAFGVAGIAIRHLVVNSWKSGKRTFTQTANVFLHQDDQFQPIADARPAYRYYGFGLPGLALGAVLGVASWSVITAARFLTNNLKTLKRSYISSLNLGLPNDGKIDGGLEDNDDRPMWRKYIVGSPGFLIGAGIGFLSAIIASSANTAKRTFRTVARSTWPAESQSQTGGLEQNDNRPWYSKYVLGFLGLPIGLIPGSAIAATAGAIRILTNSLKTTRDVFVSMTKFAWHLDDDRPVTVQAPASENAQQSTETDPLIAPPPAPVVARSRFRKYVLGMPGVVVGSFFGLFSVAAVGALHVTVNSWKSGTRTFRQTANVFLHQDDKLTVRDDARQAHRYIGFGLPGVAIGGLIGLASWPVIAAGRFMTNNWKTFKRTFISSLNLGLPDESKIPGGLEQNDDRPIFRKYIVGFPGFLAGGGTGLFTAMLASSANTAKRTFRTVARSTWPAESQSQTGGLEQNDNRPWYSKYVLGFLGLPIGLIPGSAIAATAGAIRILTNSLKTTRDVFVSMTKFTWHLNDDRAVAVQAPAVGEEHAEQSTETDPLIAPPPAPVAGRSRFRKYVLGFPGFVAGSMLGAVGVAVVGVRHLAVNSWKSGTRTFRQTANVFLHQDDKLAVRDDARQAYRYFGFGLFGVAIGGVLGLASWPVIAAGRFMTNNWKTLKRSYISSLNLGLPNDGKIDGGLEQNDNRPLWRKYIVGSLGFLAGASTGFLSAIIASSANTAKRTFRTVARSTWPVESQSQTGGLEQNDNRPWYSKYGLGLPGVFVGLVPGMVVAGMAGALRILTNSLKSTRDVLVSMTKFAWHLDDDRSTPIQAQAEGQPAAEGQPVAPVPAASGRSPFRKYVLGFPGVVVGSVFGAVSMTVVGIRHLVVNSWKSGTRTFRQTANVFLHQDNKLAVRDDARQAYRYFGFGLFGVAVGGVIGLVSWPVIAAGRFMTNNWKTLKRSYISSLNLGLPNDGKIDGGLEQNDNRPIWRKYIVGSSGFLIGAGTGFLSAIIASSANTAKRTFRTVARSAWPVELQSQTGGLEQNDNRPWLSKYGLGFPGVFVGFVPGLVIAGTVGAIRVFTNSLKTTRDIFVSSVKHAWHIDDNPAQPSVDGQAQNVQPAAPVRSGFRKNVLGAPGLFIGGVAGGVAWPVVAATRAAYQSGKSWQALSGSLMNGAIGHIAFEGLGGDERTTKQKLLGGLGYPLAVATTWPIAAIVFSGRKTPLVLGGIIGLGFSPVVAVFKGISKGIKLCRGSSRFQQDAAEVTEEQGDLEQKFMNLYSSLNAIGRFNEGAQVKINGDGEKSWGSFVRKCMTFNLNSTTEKLLGELLEAARAENCTRETFRAAAADLKDAYAANCFSSDVSVANTHDEIDNLMEFISDYVFDSNINEVKDIPQIYTQKQSWSATFWGGRANATRQRNDNVVRTEISERDRTHSSINDEDIRVDDSDPSNASFTPGRV